MVVCAENQLGPIGHFDTTHAYYRQMDGQTDRQTDRHRAIAFTALCICVA